LTREGSGGERGKRRYWRVINKDCNVRKGGEIKGVGLDL